MTIMQALLGASAVPVPFTLEYLVVAGGGGAGGFISGGGGGGGLRNASGLSLSTLVPYTVTVGAGVQLVQTVMIQYFHQLPLLAAVKVALMKELEAAPLDQAVQVAVAVELQEHLLSHIPEVLE